MTIEITLEEWGTKTGTPRKRKTRRADTVIPRHTDARWYEHPDRPCKGDDNYTEIAPLTRTKMGRARLETMKNNCENRCPVFKDCRIDLLSFTKDYMHYGLQAGIIGKAS